MIPKTIGTVMEPMMAQKLLIPTYGTYEVVSYMQHLVTNAVKSQLTSLAVYTSPICSKPKFPSKPTNHAARPLSILANGG